MLSIWKRVKKYEKKSLDDKPQSSFKRYIRNNCQDNRSEFYDDKELELIQHKIENLSLGDFLHSVPDLELKTFVENDYEFIDKETRLKEALNQIQKENKIIGIDIEQTNINSYQGYNCLIQIATQDKNYIIDAITLHDIIPKYLKPICESSSIIKVFYSGSSDLQWLNRDYGIFVVNFFDVHHASLFIKKRKDCSLVGLLSEYCNFSVSKDEKKKFQVSDWRQRPLSKEQLNYAILDAHYLIYLRNLFIEKMKESKDIDSIETFFRKMQASCLKPYEMKEFSWTPCIEYFNKHINVYKKLHKTKIDINQQTEWIEERKRFLNLCKLRDDLARQIDSNPELISSLDSLFELALELPKVITQKGIILTLEKLKECPRTLFGYISHIEKALLKSPIVEVKEKQIVQKKLIKKEEDKLIRRQRHEQNFTLKKKLYENCRVLAPDGELLSFTNRKKVQWYLNKGFAVLVQEEPLTIQLKFEPSGRKKEIAELNIDPNEYLRASRVNQCVVCGQQEKISRYHVVPTLYRQHFPLNLKNHRAYDVVLLCFRCREKANSESDQFKAEIAKRYDVPLVDFDRPQQIIQAAKSIQKIISSYLKFKNEMPKDRREQVKNNIRENFSTIVGDSLLSAETVEAFKQFTYKEDGKVKINDVFINYFLRENFKNFVEKNSNKDFKNIHGKLVVQKLRVEELKDFIDEWRMSFIHTMDPQFLPHDWNLVLQEKAKIRMQEETLSNQEQ